MLYNRFIPSYMIKVFMKEMCGELQSIKIPNAGSIQMIRGGTSGTDETKDKSGTAGSGTKKTATEQKKDAEMRLPLDVEAQQSFEFLSEQVHGLRKAFSTLSDVLPMKGNQGAHATACC